MLPHAYRKWLGLLAFALFTLILLAPDLLLLQEADPEFCGMHHPLQVLLLSLTFYGVLGGLLGRVDRLAWVMLPFAILAPGEFYYMSRFHVPSNAHVLAVVADTNMGEASAYLRGQTGLLVLVALGNLLLCVAICVLLRRWRESMPRVENGRWLVLGMSLVALELLVQFRNTAVDRAQPVEEGEIVSRVATGTVARVVQQLQIDAGYPFGVFSRLSDFLQRDIMDRRSAQRLRDFHYHARQTEAVTGKQVYVLVIGETGRRDRWQLNGYGRPTNPALSREPNLVNFPDMTVVAPETRDSVLFMLSPRDVGEVEIREKSVVSAFREAGFSTYWLSTQDSQGAIGAIFAQEAEHKAFYNPAD